MPSHQKHAKLAKPHTGYFARFEWAILGTNCGNIQRLAQAISAEWMPKLRIGYVDADHQSGDSDAADIGYDRIFTDKISFHRLDAQQPLSQFAQRDFFSHTDIVLVNGNHFRAERQLVVLDPQKTESLSRKTDRLTQVEAFLTLGDTPAEIPVFLQKKIPDWQNVPIFRLTDVQGITQYLHATMSAPSVNGLVLSGGQSLRMGEDKSRIEWHGKPQREHIADLIEGLGVPAFYSCRPAQSAEFSAEQPLIVDTFSNLGPFGAILSAFREKPAAAWLVLASDLPLLDAATLSFLLKNRQPSALASAFRSPSSPEKFPEPLITIWEPRAYPVLLRYLSQGISCPRKVLINEATHSIDAPDGAALTNVNTPEEAAEIRALLANRR